MNREDRSHAGEPESDEERPVVADAECGTRDEERDDRGDYGNVRRDDEVLEPDDDRLVACRIAQVPGEQCRG